MLNFARIAHDSAKEDIGRPGDSRECRSDHSARQTLSRRQRHASCARCVYHVLRAPLNQFGIKRPVSDRIEILGSPFRRWSQADKLARLHEVIDHRSYGQTERHEHHQPADNPERIGDRVSETADHVRFLNREQHDRDHLKHGLELPEHARRDYHALARSHHAHSRHDELARQDDEDYPRWQRAEFHERDQGRRHENLVGERVHELPEIGHLVSRPGKVAVEPIGARDNHEDSCRDDALPIVRERRGGAEPFGPGCQERGDEDRHEQYANDRDHVRGRPDGLRRRTQDNTSPSIS